MLPYTPLAPDPVSVTMPWGVRSLAADLTTAPGAKREPQCKWLIQASGDELKELHTAARRGAAVANAFRHTPMLRKAVPGESHNALQPPAYAAVAAIRMPWRLCSSASGLRQASGGARGGVRCRRGAGWNLARRQELRSAGLRSGRPAWAWTAAPGLRGRGRAPRQGFGQAVSGNASAGRNGGR